MKEGANEKGREIMGIHFLLFKLNLDSAQCYIYICSFKVGILGEAHRNIIQSFRKTFENSLVVRMCHDMSVYVAADGACERDLCRSCARQDISICECHCLSSVRMLINKCTQLLRISLSVWRMAPRACLTAAMF